jgi:hypothetical protein
MTLQDRPTAAELLDAVREFLERDVGPAVDGRLAFHARVAANVLAIVERELTLGPALETAERERLAALLGRDGSVDELTAELARRIRDGSLDGRRAEVTALVRESVRAKLTVANPRHVNEEHLR